MATRTVTIASSVGLHARPAALFVEAASAASSSSTAPSSAGGRTGGATCTTGP